MSACPRLPLPGPRPAQLCKPRLGLSNNRSPSLHLVLFAALLVAAGAPQKRRAVKLADDSELFEAGQLGAAPGGGGLTTYKELCSLATELGQPDLGGLAGFEGGQTWTGWGSKGRQLRPAPGQACPSF